MRRARQGGSGTMRPIEPDATALHRDDLLRFLRTHSTVSVPFTGMVLGLSRPCAYRAAADGSIKTLKLGARRVVVPSAWLERVLELDHGDGEESVAGLQSECSTPVARRAP